MALSSLADFSITDALNTSISGITQAENLMTPGLVNDAFRATDGSIARYLSDLAGINQTVAGTANAITVTVAQTWTALANGLRLAIKNTVGPNTSAATLAVTNSVPAALGTKAIRLQGDSALVGGEMLLNGIYEFRYDTSYNAAAGAWVLLNPSSLSSSLTSNAPFGNVAIGIPTVSGNALTIPITGLDGNVHSASNAGYVNFRSATVGSGAIAQLPITAATSIVISSGSTLGATNNVAFKGWLVAFNDAGTLRLGVINCTTLVSGVLTQYPLAAFGIASSTAEGGAGAADSAQTFYTGTAVTSKAYTVLGWFSYESGLAAVGTYGAAPTRTQTFDASVPLPGRVVNVERNQISSFVTGGTTTPVDDTIPQIGEGNQILTQPITPSSAANLLMIDFLGWGTNSTAAAENITTALHQDAVSNALAARLVTTAAINYGVSLTVSHLMIAATTSSTTFRVRVGSGGATINVNGIAGARLFGGVSSAALQIQEIAA